MSNNIKMKNALYDKDMVIRAVKDSFVKLAPKSQIKNPVMFLVFVSAIMTTVLWTASLFGIKDAESGFILGITLILWFTCLFANFAEAIAEGRGKAQADSLRAAKQDVEAHKIPSPEKKNQITRIASAKLVKDDIVIVKAGEQIPGDGEVIEGAASVDESAITGESAPVVREAGGDRSAVTGGTKVLSDWIIIRITSEPGQSFLDRMIRQADAFIPVDGHTDREVADAAQLASLPDETPEGRSIVILAKEKFNIRERNLSQSKMRFVPFTAKTRMSGVDVDGREIRKGAADSMKAYVEKSGGVYSRECGEAVKQIANQGGTPLVVTENHVVLGVIHLKDIIKSGVKEKFADLRKMGIRTVMITGDNPLTAAAIAAEAGVDDFLAEATPGGKLDMIKELQKKGHMVAMTGDGTNDAPALAQADVAVAMNTGTQAAKEAGNMVDLDSSPTKLIDIVRIGKQLLMTRGSLTTFSIANDVAKYFAIIPALFMSLYPGLAALNIMNLHSAESAIFAAIIYNALIIVALIPLALKGVRYREVPAGKLLSGNLLIYGLGGIITPFICIKLIDVILAACGLF